MTLGTIHRAPLFSSKGREGLSTRAFQPSQGNVMAATNSWDPAKAVLTVLMGTNTTLSQFKSAFRIQNSDLNNNIQVVVHTFNP